MYEIEVPSGVQVSLSESGSEIEIKGRLGTVRKNINTSLLTVRKQGQKVVIEETKNKKLARKSAWASNAMRSEISRAMSGVEKGVEKHMRMLYAHFPATIEVKNDVVLIKNIFGEKKPRQAKIIGETKVEVESPEIYVKGVDPYDVGQTVANLHKQSFLRRKDSRVFQDGIYVVEE